MLANPLKQGISRNHEPQRKSHFTLKFSPQAERESNASKDSMRLRSFPYDRMKEKREGEEAMQWNEAISGGIHSPFTIKMRNAWGMFNAKA